MSKIDLGSVSAFDIAVKNGYAGTEADWVNDIANSGGGSSLETLSDVEIENLSNGQAITYDSVDQKWKNVTLGGGGSITIDSALSTTSTNPVQNKVITSALGDKADTADLATVATSGDYDDLTNKPTIPSITGLQTQAITDTGGYFTTDTVEAALQELGATVDGIETLLAAI